jgi:propanol-preferring alcohol dehydrogenase
MANPADAIFVFDVADNASKCPLREVPSMKAMRWHGVGKLLSLEELPVPRPQDRQVLLRVRACGVCRTDLHLLDGELPSAQCPVTPGHEVVGEVVDSGPGAERFRVGERIGVPWLAQTCGQCRYCREGRENLCEQAVFTGCTVDGGYAEFALADERFCHPIPARYSDAEAAPLLCAGLIGYRAYRAAGDGRNLGLYGFGAAAHLLAQVAHAQERQVFAFTRPGDPVAQEFARTLGAAWAGDSRQEPPEPLDAAILFAPVGALVPAALAATRKGGRVICAGIHMSDIPPFPYRLLWGERSISSVANLTRADGTAFMELADKIDLRPAIEVLPLVAANEALERLRSGAVQGAAVLVPEP